MEFMPQGIAYIITAGVNAKFKWHSFKITNIISGANTNLTVAIR